MDATLQYIRKVPIWKTIIGIAIIVFSLFLFLLIGPFGLIPLGISLGLLKTEGSEINLLSKQYRKIYSVLGLKFGKWYNLPEIDYVSVFSTTESVKVRVVTAEAGSTNSIYQINLFYNTNQKIEAYYTYDKNDAFKVGHHIAEALLTDLLDATNKGHYKCVDKEYYRTTGEIKHA